MAPVTLVVMLEVRNPAWLLRDNLATILERNHGVTISFRLRLARVRSE